MTIAYAASSPFAVPLYLTCCIMLPELSVYFKILISSEPAAVLLRLEPAINKFWFDFGKNIEYAMSVLLPVPLNLVAHRVSPLQSYFNVRISSEPEVVSFLLEPVT
jgi:hypothetical protein